VGHTTVRVSEATRDLLRRLAEKEGTAMQKVLERALEVYRRRRFLERVNAAYASLRSDRRAWSAIQVERKAWDSTLSDGLPATPAKLRSRTGSRRKRRAW
jgi:hypothetical protein